MRQQTKPFLGDRVRRNSTQIGIEQSPPPAARRPKFPRKGKTKLDEIVAEAVKTRRLLLPTPQPTESLKDWWIARLGVPNRSLWAGHGYKGSYTPRRTLPPLGPTLHHNEFSAFYV